VGSVTIADELSEVLRAEAEPRHIPGAAAGVLVDGEIHTACYGVTSVEHPLPVDRATLFQVASITKTFTSAAVMLLVEAGSLALGDPAGRHLPRLAAETGLDADATTIEHLLSHQSGFDGDYLFVHRTGDIAALADARRFFAPGAGYSYNNAAFAIAGLVIEARSGMPYREFVRTRLLRPLGMKSACFSADDAITRRVAMPHFVDAETGRTIVIRRAGWQPGWELLPLDWPAGGLIASVEQLLEWCRFQADGCTRDGTRLLSQESLERLHTPVVDADATESCGLDWFVRRFGDVTTVSHNGLTPGYCSTLVAIPTRGVGIVCLTHATNGAGLNDAVYRWAMQRVAGVDVRDPEPNPSTAPDIAACDGNFLSSFARLSLAAGAMPGTFVVTGAERDDIEGWKPPPDPPTTFAFFAPDHAISIDAPGPQVVVRFGFGDDGTAEWLQWGGRRSPRIA
jgi:CubicO group peptidase (beta-lactamase class C family)